MKIKNKILPYTLACILSTSSFAEGYTLLTSETPPFSYKGESKVEGIAVQVVEELFNRAGLQYEIKLQPVARAMGSAKSKPNTCVFPLSRSQDREASFKWVSPILIKRSALYTNSGNQNLSNFYEANSLNVGVTRGTLEEEYLQKFGMKVSDTSSDKQNIKKLTADRIDYWATDNLTVNYYKDNLGDEVKATKVVDIMTSLGTLACNLSVDDSTIDKLQDTLEEMYKDGTMKKITGE